MVEQTYYYIQQGTEPFRNLALERYFLETVPEHSCLLYLWQNQHTVVIGRNQNCWQECKLQQLEQDGGAHHASVLHPHGPFDTVRALPLLLRPMFPVIPSR